MIVFAYTHVCDTRGCDAMHHSKPIYQMPVNHGMPSPELPKGWTAVIRPKPLFLCPECSKAKR